MHHKEIYKWFSAYFPNYAGDRVNIWFTNGPNSIRIRQTNGAEFVFTFKAHDNWKFETVPILPTKN